MIDAPSPLKTLAQTAFLSLLCLSGVQTTLLGTESGEEAGNRNPIIPGYYADPSIVSYEGKHYIYATIDPWGGETLSCWVSDDFSNWTLHQLNWPTKTACTSPSSKGAMVWAPSVVEGPDGRFYMHVSVGSEVWVGIAEHPLGPWEDALGGQPMIPVAFAEDYHMIDAQVFVDDDDSAYIYWGSGWNWVNGRCYAAKLNEDMTAFDGEVFNVTPSHYFEAPVMVKHEGKYYLMYSDGKTTIDTYQVHYAIGDSPLGPFEEASNSPILVTDHSKNVSSPGHNTVFKENGQHYILYHRHNIPFEPVHRQICVDELNFRPDGLIERIIPTHQGPELLTETSRHTSPFSLLASASTHRDTHTIATHAIDNNYATRWQASPQDKDPTLTLDLGSLQNVSHQELRPQFGWKEQYFVLESSTDGKQWQTVADFRKAPTHGSPIRITKAFSARYLRIRYTQTSEDAPASLFEWNIH